MSFDNSTKFGPYYVHNEVGVKTRTAGGETFKLFISAAFNAMGLIGSEADGIVVLNETRMEVVTDEILRSGNGYTGPHANQIAQIDYLLNLPDAQFLKEAAGSIRFRGEGTLPTSEEVTL